MSKEKIKSLAKKILKAKQDYYNLQPTVSDNVFDAWIDELSKLDPDNFAVTGIGSAPISSWVKVTHEIPMSSLNKVNTSEELKSWAQNDCDSANEFLVTEKLDGISVSLKYENGQLIQAATRGSGEVGENITLNVIKMKCVPLNLPNDVTLHIRGEIVLLKNDHLAYFSDYANPRNAAAGIAKRLDSEGSEHLTVICYTVEGPDFDTELQSFQFLDNLGFRTPSYEVTSTLGVTVLWQNYQLNIRDRLDYEIDGLVIRLNDRAKQFSLGEKNHRPKGAVAFKFEGATAISTVRAIVNQVGQTGRITPVAEFDEVDLLGAKVKRASLYNYSYVNQLRISVGSEVLIKRANDVIPRLQEVITENGNPAEAPNLCPDCQQPTTQQGEYLLCTNKVTCPPQVLGRISMWVSELNILEWGDKIIQKMIDQTIVSDIADIYKLKVEDISNLDRLGEKSAQNLIKELDKYREITLEHFIGGLGIENVATSTAKLVINAGYDSFEKIKMLSFGQLENIPGFGSIKAKAFVDGMKNNEQRIQNILDSGVKIKEKVKGSLTGKSFCFSGASSLPRAKLHKMVEENGGEVKKSVGASLTYLVIPAIESNTSKAQSAKKNNVTMIDEKQFMEMIK